MSDAAPPSDFDGQADSAADLRLLGPVVALWGSTWLTPWIGVWPALALIVICASASGWVVVRGRGRPLAPPAVATVTVLLAVGAGCAVSAGRVAALTSGPWHDLSLRSASVRLVGQISTDPHLGAAGWGGQPSVSLTMRVDEVRSGDTAWHLRSPVLVLGSGNAWSGVRPGERVEVSGAVHSMPQTSGLSALIFARGPPTVVEAAASPRRAAERLRWGLRTAAAGRPADIAGLLSALVVGDTSAMPQGLVDDLRAAGLSHLTAVSGANVAIVLLAVLWAARWSRIRGLALPIVGLLAVAGFVLVARPQPSVLRAAVMGSIGVLGLLTTGRRHGPRTLLAACGTLLLIDPWLARSWGFALSVAATAGLLGLAPVLRRRWSGRLPLVLIDAVAVAVAAQIATLPLQVALAGSVGLVAVLANVLAAPAVAPATVLGALAAVVSVAWPPGAAVLAWLAGWPVAWIVAVARWSSSSPLPTLHLPTGAGGLAAIVLAIAAILLAFGVWRRLEQRLGARRSRRRRILSVVLVAVLVVGWWRGPGRWPPPGWVMVVCDVGQGDALVLNVGAGSAVVVDAGPVPGTVDRCLRRLHVKNVPILVLTHDHADHAEGLPGVLRDREVGQILLSPLSEPVEQAARVSAWATATGVPMRTVAAGEQASVGPVRWQILWPARLIRAEGSDPNNASVVLMVEVSGVRMLLTGDVETAAQQAILARGVDLRAEVLKVAHHGSAAQEPAFWQAVDPRLAVVSVGIDNDYGHPNPALMAALAASGVMVRRTDLDGDIAVVVDAGGLRVVTR